ncbi:globin-coupled sensor protein [Xanthobacter sp. V4C-4]|uniref:protoglobin domain-containing protein n=1 Tax=Xanthobacter cornucopiae TaxID=3119924 RepID=UPI0037261D21
MDRLSFNLLDDDTLRLLRSSKTTIMDILDSVLDAFYAHLARTPETRRLFGHGEAMARAKTLQLKHWSVILDGRFDNEYEASVMRIGEMHHKLGLEPRWYIGGYSFLISHAVTAIGAARGAFTDRRAGDRTIRLQAAVIRAAMLDMELALDVYLQAGRRDRRATLDRLAVSFETSVGAVVSVVSSSVAELHATAQGMTAFAQQTTQQAQAVADASGRASGNVATAAAAAETLSASVQDIGHQVTRSAGVAADAVADAGTASLKVRTLAKAVDQIGGIVGLISRIAGKTNLLALNATIEAAHAGAAGRGFSVVADEVKQLAAQTSKATAEIRAQIEAVQHDTRDALMTIEGIVGTIGAIGSVTGAIAATVQQQETATADIARNVGDASQGTMQVARGMSEVAGAVVQSNAAAGRLLASATRLMQQIETLKGDMTTFADHVRAG